MRVWCSDAGDGPAGLRERLREALGHRVAGVLVGASNDAKRALLRLLVEVRDPRLEPALRLVEPEPAVLGGVGVDPGVGIARGLADGRSALPPRRSQLRHAAARFPLGLPPDVSVKPEAVLALADERQRLVELARSR